jgi:hypothetical protein
MRKLIARLGKVVKGVLTGFDRIVFKGTIRPLAYAEGAMRFLSWRGVLNRDYKRWMLGQTRELTEAVDAYGRQECGQGIIPLRTWRQDKDELARQRQKVTGRDTGLIGVWSCQESGRSYRACYCAEKGYPQLRADHPHCKHLYLYWDHADYGWMSVRLQTWFPYPIQIAMNGREWLRRRLQEAGIGFRVHGNKFFHVDDYARAQRFLDHQRYVRWPGLLDGLGSKAFPTMRQALGDPLSYYWTLWQSEWATDLIVDRPGDLVALMDSLARQAVITGNSPRVLRYLGRPVTAAGKPYANARHEVVTRVLDFYEGLRVRYWVDHNSVKAYNEHNVFRVETTVNTPGMFHVHRRATGQPKTAPKTLRPLRKGVADVALRAQVSQEVNERFVDEVATLSDSTRVGRLVAPYTCARVRQGHRTRALDLSGKDRLLLQAIADPDFTVSGITNAALRKKLRPTAWAAGRTDPQLSARITRHLRLLRQHGLIRKIPNRRRYQLTASGRQLTSALNAILSASTKQLLELVA